MSPKWQARVIPDSGSFVFENGVSVKNLWELKQALKIVREDVINEHVNDSKNDVADWVENVIEDIELAKVLRKSNCRWGMIVALERQMMRTLSLPDYVAKRWLKNAQWKFHFVDGKTADSLESLKKVLDEVSDETVAFHLERDPNDIAKWVNDVIGDYQLGDILNEATNRSQMLIFTSDHLEMLHHALTCK